MINFERSERKRVLNCIVCEFVFVNQIFLSDGRADYREGGNQGEWILICHQEKLPAVIRIAKYKYTNTNRHTQVQKHKYKQTNTQTHDMDVNFSPGETSLRGQNCQTK